MQRLIHHTKHDDGSNPVEECRIHEAFRENIEIHVQDELFFRADGGSLIVECWSRPIRKGNLAIGSVVTFVDITKRKRIEDELDTYRWNLEEKVKQRTVELVALNEELSAFAHSISHDLKVPLRAIEGFAHILGDDYNEVLDQAGQGYLEEICAGSVRMAHLIDDLLAHARLSEKFSVIGPVDMTELVAKVRRNLTVDIESCNAEIKVDGALPNVTGHSGTLEVLMQNLVSNAIKFVVPSVTPEIHIGVIDSLSDHHFFVGDNGIGIDEKPRDKIFNIFERLHTEDEYPGTGIGLAIAKKAVILHKGKIWVDPDTTKGSAFHFTLSKKLTDGSSSDG